MKKLIYALSGFIFFVLLTAAPLNADVVALYEISGGDSSGVPVTTPANVSASALTMEGVTPVSSSINGVFAAKNWSNPYNAGKYFEFSIIPGSGYEISYDSISLSLFKKDFYYWHGPEEWSLKASTDNFGSSVVDLVDFDISSAASYEQVAFTNVDISALGTQSDEVTFRLFGYGSNFAYKEGGLSNNSSFSGTGSDLIISGALVAAPEPGTLLIMSSAAIALAARKKFKKK